MELWNFNLKEIKDIFATDETENYRILEMDVSSLLKIVNDFKFDLRLSAPDEAIAYSLAGYVAKRLINNCDGCKELLSAGRMERLPVIDEGNEPTTDELRSKEEFLQMISRGGLLKPSDELYSICCHAQALYMKLTGKEENKKLLICGTSNPRNAYVEVLIRKLRETKGLLDKKCAKNHALGTHLKIIGKTMFNLFAKNLVSEENSKIQKSRKRTSKAKTPSTRKLKKLSSN